jgi:hypothetical protein
VSGSTIQARLFSFPAGPSRLETKRRRRRSARIKGRDECETSSNNGIEAAASACATLRENGAGVQGPALLRRCARCSKMRTGFEKCASWKTPRIPSKMRTLFQGAHQKLRIVEPGGKIVCQTGAGGTQPRLSHDFGPARTPATRCIYPAFRGSGRSAILSPALQLRSFCAF